jgi:hypothetical protein
MSDQPTTNGRILQMPARHARRKQAPPRKGDEARRRKLFFRVSLDEEQRMRAAATFNCQTLSDFIRDAVAEAASDALDDPIFDAA